MRPRASRTLDHAPFVRSTEATFPFRTGASCAHVDVEREHAPRRLVRACEVGGSLPRSRARGSRPGRPAKPGATLKTREELALPLRGRRPRTRRCCRRRCPDLEPQRYAQRARAPTEDGGGVTKRDRGRQGRLGAEREVFEHLVPGGGGRRDVHVGHGGVPADVHFGAREIVAGRTHASRKDACVEGGLRERAARLAEQVQLMDARTLRFEIPDPTHRRLLRTRPVLRDAGVTREG